MNKPVVSLMLASLALLSACASNSEKPPEPTELARITAPVAVAKSVWSRGAGAGFSSEADGFRIAVQAESVFTADEKGHVYAISLGDGKGLWDKDLDLSIVSGPSVVEGLVIVGTSEGEVVALDAKDGSQRWKARASGEVLAPAAGDDGVVVVRSFDGFVYGLNVEGGQRLWAVDRTVPTLTLRGISAPLIVGANVLVGTDGGHVLSIGLHDGVPVWETTVSVPTGRSELERLVDIDAALLSDGSSVYASSYAGDTAALELGSGDIQWSQKSASLEGMAMLGNTLFVTDPECRIIALNRDNGDVLWTRDELRYRECSQPAIHRGLVAVGDLEGYVHWLSPKDGQILARYRPVRDAIAPPVVADGKLLILSVEGKLVALDLIKN